MKNETKVKMHSIIEGTTQLCNTNKGFRRINNL
jgi:hypothetical protein